MIKVLLIEDDTQIVEARRLSLERLDYSVAAVATAPGDELPAILDGVDAVVLDIGLPGTDGFSACGTIRAISDVPIVRGFGYRVVP
ncbi:response regulator [Gordonia sp. MP11Mi]